MSWNSGLWITLSCETLVFLYFLAGSISAQMLHRHQLPDAWSEKKTKLIVSIDCSLSVSCCISPAHQSLTTTRISQCQCARQAAALCNKYVLTQCLQEAHQGLFISHLTQWDCLEFLLSLWALLPAELHSSHFRDWHVPLFKRENLLQRF